MSLPRTGLWAHSDFMKLWAAQTISAFGSRITREALPLAAVLTLTASPGEMGVLMAIGAAPVVVVSLLAGVWVDRLRRRPILIASDLGRALLLLTVPAAAIFWKLTIEHLYVVIALTGVLTVFFHVADNSYLPALVSREHLVEGNSKLSATDSVAEVGGPALAGLLVQAVTAPFAILFDAISFLFSALFLGAIRKAEPSPQPQEHPNVWREIGQGIRLVVSDRILRALAGSEATFSFFGSFFGTLYGLYVVRSLGVPPGWYGVLVGMGGVGGLLGAMLAGRLVRRFALGPTLLWTRLIHNVVQIALPLAGGPLFVIIPLLMATQLVGDSAHTVHSINEVSLRQTIVPDHLLGRANASTEFLAGALSPIGALLAGLLAEVTDPRLTLLIAVIGMTTSSLWLIFSPIPRLRTQPTQ